MKGNRFIFKLIAITLLAGVFTDFGCDLYAAYTEELVITHQKDLQETIVDTLIVPSSNLFTSRQSTEESELHRYTPQQPALHLSISNLVLAKNQGQISFNAFENRRSGLIKTPDIILFQHRFII